MDQTAPQRRNLCLLLAAVLTAGCLAACTQTGNVGSIDRGLPADTKPTPSQMLVAVEDEPDTVDFQCTSIYYTIAQNVFDRLVEMVNGADDNARIVPALAQSWEVSEDRRTYTFHLREGVRFSNGSPLTASDVEYTFTRLLTHPNSCNRDPGYCGCRGGGREADQG